jgi:hypothetical protein
MAVGDNIQYGNQGRIAGLMQRLLGRWATTRQRVGIGKRHLALKNNATAPTNANADDVVNSDGDEVLYTISGVAMSKFTATSVSTPIFVEDV